ncbi:hypothetical protein PLEOSDRAFT_1046958 [Pleurotus ostreatus PC15]|uniref:SWIM-type domain-containing protein n=1 Tax=Pleurotus ostreatus (strain PC15) TaxID=1137138 RepID=A0A067NB02_PLEO1|nr:hypothetical protein PLEOSDRAFT_1046958 [Pleurotus ostreatus PC15]
MIEEFPSAASYLQRELYPCREHWAHAWISSRFAAGIRTNGCCEVENRVNKSFLGPKVSLKQLFDYLNQRSGGQTVDDMVRVRELRLHVGPFALHTIYKEMGASVYYQIKTLLLPDGVRTWSALNTFQNDNTYISTQFLLRLITGRGYCVKYLFRIQRIATNATHILAVLTDGRYICDCCMGLNLGVPCRHFWCAMTHVQSLGFHIGMVRRR